MTECLSNGFTPDKQQLHVSTICFIGNASRSNKAKPRTSHGFKAKPSKNKSSDVQNIEDRRHQIKDSNLKVHEREQFPDRSSCVAQNKDCVMRY